MKKILTIAGSDSSGGAGIQADIKTITAHKMYALSVVTALTAQNTTGVYGVVEASPDFVGSQLDCVFSDIFPDAVKIGMVSNIEIIKVISEKLIEYNAENIVLDPVMVSTSGSKLLNDNAITELISTLFPLADVITPNIPEAEELCGFKINSREEMLKAAIEIGSIIDCHILIKGGHLSNQADDLIYYKDKIVWLNAEKIDNPNTHGTGCTLSSAIACNMADDYTVADSIGRAKEYLTGSLKYGLNLGKGRGPLNHTFGLIRDF